MEVNGIVCIECGCGTNNLPEGRFRSRRFLTKTEKVERLKSYAEELKKELAAVEERIKELGFES